MRIAIFSDNFYPELGGIQDSIEALATALAQRGHDIDFYVPRYSRRDFQPIKVEPHEIDLGPNISVHRLPSVPYPTSTKQSRMVLPFPFACLQLFGSPKPDVVHSQTFFGVGLNALLASRLLGIPLVGTNHTAIRAFTSYIPIGMDRIAAYVRWYYNQCDFVTAPSRSVFTELGGRLRCDCEVVSNPVATELFRPASAMERRNLKTTLGLRGPTVTYAGRLGPEKNIDPIFRAIALVKQQIPSVELAIAGHGSAETHLRELAQRLQIDGSVRFFGTLPKRALANLFRATDLFATMSISETQSVALLQAMACGTPALVANARALPEYVTYDRGALVDPFDFEALSGHIVRVLADADLHVALGQNAAVFAKQFSVDVVADKWEAIYRATIIKKGTSDERSSRAQLRRTSP